MFSLEAFKELLKCLRWAGWHKNNEAPFGTTQALSPFNPTLALTPAVAHRQELWQSSSLTTTHIYQEWIRWHKEGPAWDLH